MVCLDFETDDKNSIEINKKLNKSDKNKTKELQKTTIATDSSSSEINEENLKLLNKKRKYEDKTEDKNKTLNNKKDYIQAFAPEKKPKIDKHFQSDKKYNFNNSKNSNESNKKEENKEEEEENELIEVKKTKRADFTKNSLNYSTNNINNHQKQIKQVNNNNSYYQKGNQKSKACNYLSHEFKKAGIDYEILLENEYFQIPNQFLENVSYLKDNYPGLFEKDTNIIFRIFELTDTGPGPSKLKQGRIEGFNEDTKNLLINVDNNEINKQLVETYQLNNESDLDLIACSLSKFLELWIHKTNLSTIILPGNNNNNTESILKDNKEKQNSNNVQTTIPNINNIDETSTKESKNSNKIKDPLTNNTNNNKRLNKFERIIYPQIRKQIEYYLSDSYFNENGFLQAQQDENGCI